MRSRVKHYKDTIIQYKILNAHNVCQLAESEAWAVTGGTWHG